MATATGTATETTTTIAKVGQPAPDFNMPSTKNIETLKENVKLADYKGKWLILLFYPLDFTFVCPTELIHFSDRLEGRLVFGHCPIRSSRARSARVCRPH